MADTDLKPHHVLMYIFGMLAIVLNGVLLLSMYNDRKKIFVTRISYLVANLAFADCLNGLFFIILQQPIKVIAFERSDVHTKLILPLTWTAFLASFLTLFLMAAERLVVVTLPMVWSTLLTIPRTILCIILVWMISIGGGVATHLKVYYAQFFICLFVELSALCFIATHVYILWILRKREKFRKVETTPDQDSSQATPCLEPKDTSYIAHRKVTIVVTILLAVLIITCVPYLVCLQMFTINNTFDPTLDERVNVDIFDIVNHYSDAFGYINFLANPIIYAWRLRMYRKAFFSLLGRSST